MDSMTPAARPARPPARPPLEPRAEQAGRHARSPGGRGRDATWPFKAGSAGQKTEDARALRAVRTNNSWRRGRSRREGYGKSACRVFEWRVATRAEGLPAAALPRPLACVSCCGSGPERAVTSRAAGEAGRDAFAVVGGEPAAALNEAAIYSALAR